MGAKTITETLLEMYYFSALRDYFCELLGEDDLRMLKPSPNREKWLGFDQGWVKAKKTGLPLEKDLKSFIHSDRKPLDVFRAFFLQFKVVGIEELDVGRQMDGRRLGLPLRCRSRRIRTPRFLNTRLLYGLRSSTILKCLTHAQ